MQTVIVEIKNELALRFLKDMEKIKLIRLLQNKVTKSNTKLSEKYFGSIPEETAEKLQEQLKILKDEWERNIS